MMIYAMLALLGVFVVKYYTAVEMRKLERRLMRVKEDLIAVKSKLADAQGDTNESREEEEGFEERVRRIKETIEDLEIRLTTSREEQDNEVAVS
jgi:predicted  nucleic acid-binding Zn-ribbon protein